MRLSVLYSGGKDSTLALMKAREFHTIVCLITLVSENKESYLFHTPNIDVTRLQAEAMQLPLIRVVTKGEKEKEVTDLKKAVAEAKNKYNIEGVVTGAVRSTYQASRIQHVCHELGLWCFNPLWLKDQVELLNEVVEEKIHAIIGGVFAEPLDASYLGKKITLSMVEKLAGIASSHHINPAGEGGEIETTVLDAPVFKKRISVKKHSASYRKHAGIWQILEAELVNK
ncbi:diphthine--ammonia ligase [Candidatus Woesearchaeota archaeon]|nr:diphthine--ammonia ligase [Candidatus Woesearchaeota archaeon]